MSASDAGPVSRLGETFFDVRGSSRSMRLTWHGTTGVAVISIWQGGTCTGTFRVPADDLSRLVDSLRRGVPGGQADHATGPLPLGGQPSALTPGAASAEPFTGAMIALPDTQPAGYGRRRGQPTGGFPAIGAGRPPAPAGPAAYANGSSGSPGGAYGSSGGQDYGAAQRFAGDQQSPDAQLYGMDPGYRTEQGYGPGPGYGAGRHEADLAAPGQYGSGNAYGSGQYDPGQYDPGQLTPARTAAARTAAASTIPGRSTGRGSTAGSGPAAPARTRPWAAPTGTSRPPGPANRANCSRWSRSPCGHWRGRGRPGRRRRRRDTRRPGPGPPRTAAATARGRVSASPGPGQRPHHGRTPDHSRRQARGPTPDRRSWPARGRTPGPSHSLALSR